MTLAAEGEVDRETPPCRKLEAVDEPGGVVRG